MLEAGAGLAFGGGALTAVVPALRSAVLSFVAGAGFAFGGGGLTVVVDDVVVGVVEVVDLVTVVGAVRVSSVGATGAAVVAAVVVISAARATRWCGRWWWVAVWVATTLRAAVAVITAPVAASLTAIAVPPPPPTGANLRQRSSDSFTRAVAGCVPAAWYRRERPPNPATGTPVAGINGSIAERTAVLAS